MRLLATCLIMNIINTSCTDLVMEDGTYCDRDQQATSRAAGSGNGHLLCSTQTEEQNDGQRLKWA